MALLQRVLDRPSGHLFPAVRSRMCVRPGPNVHTPLVTNYRGEHV